MQTEAVNQASGPGHRPGNVEVWGHYGLSTLRAGRGLPILLGGEWSGTLATDVESPRWRGRIGDPRRCSERDAWKSIPFLGSADMDDRVAGAGAENCGWGGFLVGERLTKRGCHWKRKRSLRVTLNQLLLVV